MKTVMTRKSVGSEAVTEDQLLKINQFTRRELTADEVFVFSVVLCDNEIDRDGERFPRESLDKLAELFIGKTGVFDHNPKAENQSARIFEAQVIEDSAQNSLNEAYVYLKAMAYMVRSEKNADLILEIDAGIKKEVSVGCTVEQVLCSICGADQKTSSCSHNKGNTYDGAICCHELVNPTDAYEWSFVAVPAQKNAGVTKKYGDKAKQGTCYELAKLFAAPQNVVLTKSEVLALKAEYLELKALAQAGNAYADTLRREVVKLATLAEPTLKANVMENVCEKLDVSELLAFKKTFSKSASKAYPIATQLGNSTDTTTNFTNTQFKI